MAEPLCIIPDTNVFLHFPPLKDIDWCAISGAWAVNLIVCMTVVHELDEKKSDTRLSKRAERAIKEIREAERSGAPIRDGVRIRVFNREFRATDFPETLSPDSADDRIVQLLKLFEKEFPGTSVAIATADYGMELRASVAGVRTISLDPSLRLPNPQDELTQKYRRAINDLNALKSRSPKLTLWLARPGVQPVAPHEAAFELETANPALNTVDEIDRVRREHPTQGLLRGIMTGSVSDAAWTRYDAQLEKFYDDHREWAELVNTIRDTKSRSFSFELWLVNEGTAVANDVDVLLKFPPAVSFLAEKGSKDAKFLEQELQSPTPPQIPNPFETGFGSRGLQAFQMMPDIPDLGRRLNLDPWTPNVTVGHDRDDRKQIEVFIGKAKHGYHVRLGVFVAVFRDRELARPFGAEYMISATDLGEGLEGELPFIIKIPGST